MVRKGRLQAESWEEKELMEWLELVAGVLLVFGPFDTPDGKEGVSHHDGHVEEVTVDELLPGVEHVVIHRQVVVKLVGQVLEVSHIPEAVLLRLHPRR